ncbi:protein CFAP276-like [Oscarella lobularis]|uniref:protein CFAP276-like n=1 Tax=Oscarella lobularis TaxID=121494 RepID=UPI003313AADD
MSRDPYPFPRQENDSNFTKEKSDPTQYLHGSLTLKSKENPWERLNQTATLASDRRHAFHFDPKAPRDSLDLVLKAHYDHHSNFLRSKAETLIQPETIGLPHGRILKNRASPEEYVDRNEMDYVEAKDKRTLNPHSIGGAIESHHSAATNRGYSRKDDGGFYTT